jgi:hypothetical protein
VASSHDYGVGQTESIAAGSRSHNFIKISQVPKKFHLRLDWVLRGQRSALGGTPEKLVMF